MRKSALIVDDSRVAMVTLKRLLEPHGLAVDLAESGPEALEFLRQNVPPAVIFLDHMMPGMDGFEVLALIKREARLSAVPVVMYTSQEGENYMGQALAHGAFAVLRKPPSPLSLLSILEKLGLAAEPPTAVRPASEVAVGGAARAVTATPVPVTPTAVPQPMPRAVAARAPAASASTPIASTAENRAGGWGVPLAVLYAVMLLVPAVWFFQQYRAAEQARATLAEENRALAAAQAAAPVEPAMTPLALPAPEPPAEAPPPRWLETLTWAVNLRNQYAYDQLPLDDQRLGMVRELIARLTQSGFEGLVRLDTHVGEFCLTRDGFGGFKLPEPTAPIADCEIVDYTDEQAVTLGRRQSPAFSRFLVTQASQRNPVRVEVVSHGNQRPLVNYPNVSTLRTAGEWNAIAARNQRVQIAIVRSADDK